MWKYLQILLFSIVTNVESEDSFGKTAKLFEAINADELKSKLEDTLKDVETMFNKQEEESNNDSENNESNSGLPDPSKIHDHLQGMMKGKLGGLAKELAEDTVNELGLDDKENPAELFEKLFKNPTKMMGLVSKVGSKLDSKIKAGDLKESELLQEASEMMSGIKNFPGMKNFESMFQKMGMPGMPGMGGIPGMPPGGKVNMGAFNAQMESTIRAAKMRERMREQHERNQESKMQSFTPEDSATNNTNTNFNQSIQGNAEETPKVSKPRKRKPRAKKA